jgi:exodeoxyribonuclease V alpha subunit
MNRPTTLSPAGTASLGPGSGVPAGLLDLMQSSDLDESSAFLAWQLARLPRGPSPAERDDLAMLLGRLLVAQARGSTRLVLDDAACALLASAPELAGSAGTPLVLDGNHLYTQRAHACEARVAVRLATRLEPGPFSPEQLRQAVDDAAAIAAPPPSAEQKAAVVAALGRRLGVISGGPGTGKTSTALLLVRSLARLGVPPAAIALTAPTGKAKSRLQEDFRARLGSLAVPPAVDRELLDRCPEAQTLHHLLGATAGPGGFAHRAREPLPYRAVIVDESSMVDLVLMDRLLDALPAAGQLVLLGDADQLPSVSAGAVFRDLGDVATRLRQGFRADPARPTGRQLVALAESIRAGAADTVAALCVTRARVGELRRQGAEHLAAEHRDELLRAHHARLFDPAARGDLIHRVYALRGELFEDDESPRLDYLARCLGQARVLAVTRQGPAGAERCNAFLHDLQGGGPSLLPGEPVLMLRNDYQRELWNGDAGMVVRAGGPGQAVATVCAFRSRRGWLAVDPWAVGPALGLGYALTVHKAQGSEYDEVLLLLPDYRGPLLTRELVYTAVSRARESVVVCGSLEILKTGVAAREERSSGIGERMAGGSKPT